MPCKVHCCGHLRRSTVILPASLPMSSCFVASRPALELTLIFRCRLNACTAITDIVAQVPSGSDPTPKFIQIFQMPCERLVTRNGPLRRAESI